MESSLVGFLKSADTLEGVFKLFQKDGGHVRRSRFNHGEILSVKQDYAIVGYNSSESLDDTSLPMTEGVHPYGSDIVYTFERKEKEES